MANADQTLRLEGAVTDLLVDLATAHWAVPELHFARMFRAEWAGYDLSEYAGNLELTSNGMKLFLEASPEGDLGELCELMRIRNKPAAIVLADRSVVRSELAHMPRLLGSRAEIDLYHWSWTTDAPPALWCGCLHGRVPRVGNLRVAERQPTRFTCQTGFRLEGRYVWYILSRPEADRHDIVLDPRGEPVTRDAVVADVLAMQFAMGKPLRIDYLVGLDAGRQAVAAVAVGHLVRDRGHRSPVPDGLFDANMWVPHLFRLVASKLATEGLEPLMIGISSYLDSESDHLDGAYLKAQVGLEALSKRLLKSEGHELLVRDEVAWTKWLVTLKPIVREHLLDPEKVGMVHGKFVTAGFAPTGDMVKRVLAEYGITLPREVVQEIKKRNYPAHGFLMNETLDHEFDRDVRRLEMIQTLISAVVAAYVGYGGPLNGYDVDDDGQRPSPSWWPIAEGREDVERSYLAERVSGTDDAHA